MRRCTPAWPVSGDDVHNPALDWRMTHTRFVFAALLVSSFPTPAVAQSRSELVARLDSIAAAPVKAGNQAGLAVAALKGPRTPVMPGGRLHPAGKQGAVP